MGNRSTESMGSLPTEMTMSSQDRSSAPPTPRNSGISFPRYFTARLEAGRTPYDEVQWETRTASIGNDKGSVIFEQRDVEVPADWSQTATNIVASKYFHGKLGSPRARDQRRPNWSQRVVDTIADWGNEGRLLPDRRGRRELPHRTGAPDAHPEGLLQFAGLVQRRREGSARLRLGLRQASRTASPSSNPA